MVLYRTFHTAYEQVQGRINFMVLCRTFHTAPEQGLGRMGCMVLCRTFHTAPEQGPGRMGSIVLRAFHTAPEQGQGRIDCMVLCRTFHTAPEQGQEPEWGPIRIYCVPIFQILKLLQVVCFNGISMAFRCPVLVPDTGRVKGFCIISVPVPATSSVNYTMKVH